MHIVDQISHEQMETNSVLKDQWDTCRESYSLMCYGYLERNLKVHENLLTSIHYNQCLWWPSHGKSQNQGILALCILTSNKTGLNTLKEATPRPLHILVCIYSLAHNEAIESTREESISISMGRGEGDNKGIRQKDRGNLFCT